MLLGDASRLFDLNQERSELREDRSAVKPIQRFRAAFGSVAGILDAAERHFGQRQPQMVDRDHSGLDRRGDRIGGLPADGADLPPGGAVVLYTDGVIESRRGRDLFGQQRMDDVLAANASQPAQVLADELLAACRTYAGGDLPDDCAIVVIKRLALTDA